MNRRHAHQIRAGINAARLAYEYPMLGDALRPNLTPLGRIAFKEWCDNQPNRERRARMRLRAERDRQRIGEFRMRHDFADIINFNWGADA